MTMARYLVIGGAGGVGSAVVSALVNTGNPVVASVLNEAEREAVRSVHPDVETFILDLSDPASVAGEIRDTLGDDRLDGVAVCAAFAPIGLLERAEISQFERTFSVNVTSALAIYQAVIPKLRESAGRLVMISSMAGKVSLPFVGVYSASKFGLEGLADAMRREAAGHGVRVCLVEPGGIRTPMVDVQLAEVDGMIANLSAEEDALYGAFYRGFRSAASHSHTQVASSPEQVAQTLLKAFTDAEPAARYISGADAEGLLGAARAQSDEQMDAIIAQMFDEAG